MKKTNETIIRYHLPEGRHAEVSAARWKAVIVKAALAGVISSNLAEYLIQRGGLSHV